MLRTFSRVAKRAAYWMLLPFMRLALRLFPADDPWERIEVEAPPAYHGARRDRDFGDYLRGESQVGVTSLAAMEEWLRGCTYEAVPIRMDDWSALPTDFESGRAGNCLDHALWAWRKLGELGYSAELVVGRRGSAPLGSRHAWVVFEHAGTRHLVETAAKQPDTPMVYDLPEIGDEYWPEFGVDSTGRRFAYGGYLRTLQAQLDAAWHSRGESTGRPA